MAQAVPKPTRYREFWRVYLAAHRRRGTRALHYLGSVLGLALVATGLVLADWRVVLVGAVAGYALAWTGHFGIEKNRPATFGHPVWSLLSDFRMLGLAFTGRLKPHLEAALPTDGDRPAA